MITIWTSETIDLTDIESLRKWIEYMPECFTSNLDSEEYNDRLVEDRFILHNINKLYSLIKEIIGQEPDYEDSHFNVGKMNIEQKTRLDKIKNNIPEFNIKNYAKLKLSEEEQLFCYSFVNKCSMENSNETMEEIEGISNYFLKSYAKYLLIHAPESNYKFSESNIRKSISDIDKKLDKAFRKIRRQEIDAWLHAKDRIYY